ncbi:MAG: N-acetylglucosamine-6-phosphate deacetylase [Oscillospiraceae bacterium]|nr:N-acetylglucosamine-6-phosphate deacetylase [Oscillospiraceae bacterium]
MRTLVQNGMVILPHRVIPTGGVMVEGGKITDILDRPISAPPADIRVIDAAGRVISPGFVDIHVHGGGGLEFMGSTPEEIAKICAAHSRFGTTSILPATLTAPIDELVSAIQNIRAAKDICKEADILGVHLEGPFISQQQRGAQAPEYILTPDEDSIKLLLDHGDIIRMMGAAPEIPGGFELGREIAKRGITASISHSDATFEQIEQALDYGYADVTHIYSGCSSMHRKNAYRIAGVVEAGLYFDELTVSVIADGKHLPPPLLKLIYKCKGANRIALITDGLAASAAGYAEGTVYTQKNGVQTILEDGVMKLPDRSSFAGSCADMPRLVRVMTELAGVPLADAVKMASQTPANIIGKKNKGRIAIGCDADIILFDKNIDVSFVMLRGEVVQSNKKEGKL